MIRVQLINLSSLMIFVLMQVFYPDGYGGYVPHPPYATQMVYSADGQQYAVAYPYHYQGNHKWLDIYPRAV